MTLTELKSWHEYDSRELLPDRRTEMQLAQIAYIYACSNSRNPSQYKLADFMPSSRPRMQTPEEFYRSLKNG